MGDISAALTDMWRSVLLFLPKAVAFAVIMVIGVLVATAVRKMVVKGLDRVGFERLVHRGELGRMLARSRFDTSDVLARIVYYALLLLTLQLAFGVWGPNPISDLISGVVAWLPRAFVAIVIVVVATAIASAVKDLIGGALGGLSYGRFLASLASWFIIGLGAIAALNQVGIATAVTTPLLVATLATIAGILIVGVGGGLVRPMTQRWDRWLERAEAESEVIRDRARAFAAGREDAARQLAEHAGGAGSDAAHRDAGHRDAGTRDAGHRDAGTRDRSAPVLAGAASRSGAVGGTGGPVDPGTAPDTSIPAAYGGEPSTTTYQSSNALHGAPGPAASVEETQRIAATRDDSPGDPRDASDR